MAQRRLTTQRVLRDEKNQRNPSVEMGLRLSARQVGASLRISHSTVGEYLKRAQQDLVTRYFHLPRFLQELKIAQLAGIHFCQCAGFPLGPGAVYGALPPLD